MKGVKKPIEHLHKVERVVDVVRTLEAADLAVIFDTIAKSSKNRKTLDVTRSRGVSEHPLNSARISSVAVSGKSPEL